MSHDEFARALFLSIIPWVGSIAVTAIIGTVFYYTVTSVTALCLGYTQATLSGTCGGYWVRGNVDVEETPTRCA